LREISRETAADLVEAGKGNLPCHHSEANANHHRVVAGMQNDAWDEAARCNGLNYSTFPIAVVRSIT